MSVSARPMRGDTALGVTLQIVAAIMILAAGIGLVIHIQRRGQLGRLGVAGVCSCVVGVALLVAAGFVPATIFGRGIDAVPFFVIPGVDLGGHRRLVGGRRRHSLAGVAALGGVFTPDLRWDAVTGQRANSGGPLRCAVWDRLDSCRRCTLAR